MRGWGVDTQSHTCAGQVSGAPFHRQCILPDLAPLPLALAGGKCLIFHIEKDTAKLFESSESKCRANLLPLSLSLQIRIIAAESDVNVPGS